MSRLRVGLVAAAAALILLGVFGVRPTTTGAQQKKDAKFAEAVSANARLQDQLDELKIRYDQLAKQQDDLIDYIENGRTDTPGVFDGIITVPGGSSSAPYVIDGSDDSDDSDDDPDVIVVPTSRPTTVAPTRAPTTQPPTQAPLIPKLPVEVPKLPGLDLPMLQ